MTNQLDALFSALSDPTRRAVVERLAQDSASVSTLHAPHDMALPTFLRHLKVLEDSGLITTRKKGRTRTAQINPAALAPIEAWIADHKTLWEGRLDRLTRLADHMERTRS
jgi:DNA-binding transcriptional ArsR family regulator